MLNHKKKRVLLIITGILIIVLLILSFFANSIAEKKIESLLKEHIPAHIESKYEAVNVHVFRGSVTFKNPQIKIHLIDTNLVQTSLQMNSFTIGGISYWNYLMNKEISIGKINFKDLEVITYKDRKNPKKDSIPKKPINLPGTIDVSKFTIQNAKISVYDSAEDSTFVHTEKFYLDLRKVELNNNTLQNNIPLNYESIAIQSDSTFLKLGAYENLILGKISLEKKDLELEDIILKTKYNRAELSRIAPQERDHFDVVIESLSINQMDWGNNDGQGYFSTPFISIKNPSANIYRDKLLPDDYKIKKLYSQALRELPLQLTIDSVALKNGAVTYGEKTKAERPPGELYLSNLNAGISDLSNTYTAPTQTRIEVTGTFMKNSPLQATWMFDVNKPDDAFTFKAQMGKLKTSDMNPFLTPILNLELQGEVIETHFDITGDFNQSIINIAQNYDDINVTIFNKKNKRLKTISNIANVFINNDSKKDGKTFHNVTANTTRDKTKSFFNYLARNLKASLISMYTQKDKSDKKKKKKA